MTATLGRPVFAGSHRLNGNGELTGLEWIRESGLLTSPIGLTNTHSVGVVRDALSRAAVAAPSAGEVAWSLPVVGETWDGRLNDIDGFHVTRRARRSRRWPRQRPGPSPRARRRRHRHDLPRVQGRHRHGSRVLGAELGGCTVGVLVQANYGRRERLRVDGVPVGRAIPDRATCRARAAGGAADRPGGRGSIIVVVATDAPLLPAPVRAARPAGRPRDRAGRAASARRRAATSSSRSRRATAACRRLGRCAAAPLVDAPDGASTAADALFEAADRGHRGGDRERARGRRDDGRPRRHHGPRLPHDRLLAAMAAAGRLASPG